MKWRHYKQASCLPLSTLYMPASVENASHMLFFCFVTYSFEFGGGAVKPMYIDHTYYLSAKARTVYSFQR